MGNKVGRPKTKKKAELYITGSIRLSPAQWKTFKGVGGAKWLRERLAKVTAGKARHAK